MQPTFLPWMGYFSLMSQVDIFIFLDNVKFVPRSWQQRNRILMQNSVKWLTVPVSTPHGNSSLINAVQVNKEHYSPAKLVKSLKHSYNGLRGETFVESEINPLFFLKDEKLMDLNTSIILKIAKALNITCDHILASSLDPIGKKSELILDICLKVGATNYLSPVGSLAYLDDFDGFKKAHIPINYQNFIHPEYRQNKNPNFIPNLSIIDAIFNLGIDKVKELLIRD